MRYLRAIMIIPVFILNTAYAGVNGFNADSAYAFIEHLCLNIGARNMGSVNERKALFWTVKKFQQYGADTSFVLPVRFANKFNTNSGVAVGIFRGKTDSSIVIGGHIDSSGDEIQGANDDASGVACVIELAREWSNKDRHFTMIFTAFGGEEKGLLGSKYFVEHYQDIDDVILMLQIDMAGNEDPITLFLGVKTHQAPEWLVKDAYAIDSELGYNSLEYPTHFFSLNDPIGGAGSDHQPFLDKDIPAIGFIVGMENSPVHTQQDRIGLIKKSSLERSGRLVNAMITKYQHKGVPEQHQGHYMLWQWGRSTWFIPNTLVVILVVIVFILGLFTIYHSRENRLQIEKSERVRFSTTKLFLMMVIIAVFTQLGEVVIQLFKGLRYPWLVPFDRYLFYAAIWSVAGLWVSLQLTKRWRFSQDPHVYTLRSAVILLVYVSLFFLVSPRLALYPALTLLGLCVAVIVPNPTIKIIATLMAPLPMIRLMFMETLSTLARTLVQGGAHIDNFLKAFVYGSVLTLVLVIWYLPSLYLFSQTFMSVRHKLDAIVKGFRGFPYGIVMLLIMIGYGIYLSSFSSYNEDWRALIQLRAEYDMNSQENKLELAGNEYFRNVDVVIDTLKKHYDGRIHKDNLRLKFRADWIKISGKDSVILGERKTVLANWQITSEKPLYITYLKIYPDTLEIQDIKTDLKYTSEKNELNFSWLYAAKPDTLNVAVQFSIDPGAKLIREVRAIYTELPFSAKITSELADVNYRTVISYTDTLEFPVVQELE